MALDGYERIVLAVNGQYPGPTVEANWGDTVSKSSYLLDLILFFSKKTIIQRLVINAYSRACNQYATIERHFYSLTQ
jgi:Multicopper oxidase